MFISLVLHTATLSVEEYGCSKTYCNKNIFVIWDKEIINLIAKYLFYMVYVITLRFCIILDNIQYILIKITLKGYWAKGYCLFLSV